MFKRSTSNNLLVFGAGLAAGWVVKQLFDSPEFQTQKDNLAVKASEIRDRLTDIDEGKKVKEIFGKASKDMAEVYHEAKETLIEELDTLKLSFEEIDKQKYVDIVTGIATSLRNDQRLPEEHVQNLTRSLISDFKNLRERRKEFKNVRKDIASEIDEELEKNA